MWRNRRWRDLLTFIDWLPRNSAYMEALSDDEEVAEEYLNRPKSDAPQTARPRISEWSSELEKLTDVVDRLGEVMQAVVASNGGKPPKIRPQPRPRTAVDKLREKKRYEHHKKVVSRVLIQNPDGTTRPIAMGPPPKRISRPTTAPPSRPPLLPGEDPYRLKAPRRRGGGEGAVTGEPKLS